MKRANLLALQRSVDCPTCGATAGNWCKSVTGRSVNPHGARKTIAWAEHLKRNPPPPKPEPPQ